MSLYIQLIMPTPAFWPNWAVTHDLGENAQHNLITSRQLKWYTATFNTSIGL